ncbi:unnamed protein product [Vitrella brassicaformis CCMP3155]|uniref:EamA domain-containing protein n=2 Tax=Vitrella brassicaformis TaxID=1169539 RepID=A0A0G4G9E2_VITBC|nr:unnamed protein product [Vitrella brassicaformis CCMP3155]|eukprot:CEM25293.1 unnamed protein product [Vitrella brassicaformis CCMP3155]
MLMAFFSSAERLAGVTALTLAVFVSIVSNCLTQLLVSSYSCDSMLLMSFFQTCQLMLLAPKYFAQLAATLPLWKGRCRGARSWTEMADVRRVVQERLDVESDERGGEALSGECVREWREHLRMALPMGLLYFLSCYFAFVSLSLTSISSFNIIWSTVVFFSYIGTILVFRDPFSPPTFIFLLVSFSGICVTILTHPASPAHHGQPEHRMHHHLLGGLAALMTTICSAAYAIYLRYFKITSSEIFVIAGWIGLLTTVACPLVLLLASVARLEPFAAPPPYVLLLLLVNGACAWLPDFMLMYSMTKLPMLVAQLVVTLVVPLAILTDTLVLRRHNFSVWYLIGAAIAFAGVLGATNDIAKIEKKIGQERDRAHNQQHQQRGGLGDEADLEFDYHELEGDDDDKPTNRPAPARPERSLSAASTRLPSFYSVPSTPSMSPTARESEPAIATLTVVAG